MVLGGWDAMRLADVSHLKKGAARDWGFEDIKIEDGKVIEDLGEPGSEHDPHELVGLQLYSNL